MSVWLIVVACGCRAIGAVGSRCRDGLEGAVRLVVVVTLDADVRARQGIEALVPAPHLHETTHGTEARGSHVGAAQVRCAVQLQQILGTI